MKTKLLFILSSFLFLAGNINGQALATGEQSPSWTVYNKNMVIDQCVTCEKSVWNQEYLTHDSIFKINGKEYYKITSKINCGSNTPYNKNIISTGYYRVDGDKAWFKPLDDSKDEFLIYDFSLEEGDQFTLPERDMILNVEKVDHVTIDGKERKRIQLTGNIKVVRDTITWYEGIGSDRGPFYNLFRFQIIFSEMRCYLTNDKSVFTPSPIKKCRECLATGEYFGPDETGMESMTLNYQIGEDKLKFENPIFEKDNNYKVYFYRLNGAYADQSPKVYSNIAVLPKGLNGTYILVVVGKERRFVSKIEF